MTIFPVTVQQSFLAEATSVPEARRFTRRTLDAWQAAELVDVASVIVSELVTNAVVHTGTPVRLTLVLRAHQLRIEVEDHHPGRRIPVVTDTPADTAEHGRGLMITASLSTAWGVDYTREAKRVWVMCERETAPFGTEAVGDTWTVAGSEPHVAVVDLGSHGEVRGWNPDATAMFGWSAEEVAGRPWAELVDGEGPAPVELAAAEDAGGWQGSYAVRGRDGVALPVFASHLPSGGHGTVALVVEEEQRHLLEHPPMPVPPAGADARAGATFGLREDALVRLGVEEYLTLAAEQIRDPVAADATYLLLAHDFDEELEVVAVSGLPEDLLGTRLAVGARGTPDPRRPTMPVLVDDDVDADISLLAGTGLRSLAVAPLVVEHKQVGAVAAAAGVAGAFGEEQAAVLQRFADSIALAADRARLQASERARRDWLSFIADAGDLLAGSLDQDMTMAITGQVVVPRIGAWCAIHLCDSRDHPVLQQVWHRDEERLEALRSAVAQVGPDALAAGSPLVDGRRATSIPLTAHGRLIGHLTIGRPPEDLLAGEFRLVVDSIVRRAALALDNARTHGALQAAGRTLQESLLPPALPAAPGLDVGVVYQAAGEETAAGGDFYDLFPTGSGTWCFVVGDVCGTGAAAAAVTGLARHTIRALVRTGLPLAATLERLNSAILDEGTRSRFLTLVCGTLHLEGGRLQLELVNAGHPPPYVVDGAGAVRELGTPQTLLGVVDPVAYTPQWLHLERGDLLVAVTDGVLERRAGDRMLGEGPFAEHLASLRNLPAQAVAERIHRLVQDFSDEPQQDDVAVLAIRALAGRPGLTSPLLSPPRR